MRLNREVTAILIFLAIFVVAGILLGGNPQSDSRSVLNYKTKDPSIYNDRDDGNKAIYLWTQREGYRAGVLENSWSSLPTSQAATLVAIDPDIAGQQSTFPGFAASPAKPTELTAKDASLLRAWVAQGHTAVILSSDTTDSFGSTSAFASALGLNIDPNGTDSRQYYFAPLQPFALTKGISDISSDSGSRILLKKPADLALFGDSTGPIVTMRAMGKGTLYVIADNEFLNNINIARPDNLRFYANILARSTPAGARVLFDEYHHGDTNQKDESVWGVLGHPLQSSLIQLGLACLLLIASLAVRFGPPIPLGQGASRTTAEYLATMAGLYRRAGATTTALATVYKQFRVDICRFLDIDPGYPFDKVLELTQHRSQLKTENLSELLTACERAIAGPKISEQEMLELMQRMEHVREEMKSA